MTQGELFKPSIQERFEDYHAEHPEVYGYLVAFARELRGKGFSHYSIKTLWERLRWHFHVDRDEGDYKLNNNYHSRYARKLMADYPEEFSGFFELRELKSD